MSEVVEWVLNLKDQFSHVLHGAKERTEEFERTVDKTKEHANNMLSSLGISFAAFEGLEFIKKAKEEFEQLEQATSQLEAGLESTRGIAGVTFDGLQESAVKAAHDLKFTQGQIEQMQSILLTFPSVTKKTFGDASQAIYDMSTRLHQDLDSTAIQVGKALQDPIKGITALRRVGVNFNEAQTVMIKNMVAGGHAAQAQAYILKELQTEFGGSAAAAAKADVAFRFNKSWEEIKLTVGELANNFLKKLAPALEWISRVFQSATGWMKEHREIMSAIEDVLLPVVAAITGIITVVKIWTAVQWALNIALKDNPIGVVITLIAAFVGIIVAAYQHVGWFRGGLWGLWGVIKELGAIVRDVFMGIGEMMHGITHFNLAEIKEGWGHAASAIGDAAQRIGKAARDGYQAGLADFAKDQVADPNAKAEKGAKAGKMGPAGPTGPTAEGAGNRVSGQKILNIQIHIDSLIRSFTVQATNISQSYGRIKEEVAKALISAVNDSQIIGDH